jgi:hypothetical protein
LVDVEITVENSGVGAGLATKFWEANFSFLDVKVEILQTPKFISEIGLPNWKKKIYS